MKLIRSATVAALLASFFAIQPPPVMAQGRSDRDRYEKATGDANVARRRERAGDRREDRREARHEARQDYWDAARYYRQDDRRYRQRRLGRNDRIYRGSDSRYYCKRDDGTTGLIIGGISGAVLGTIIAPGESKVLGTIIGAGAGVQARSAVPASKCCRAREAQPAREGIGARIPVPFSVPQDPQPQP